MNTERLLILADHVDGVPKKPGYTNRRRKLMTFPATTAFFDMWSFREDIWGTCQTAACIAGHTVLRFSGLQTYLEGRMLDQRATELLELTRSQAVRLFQPFQEDLDRLRVHTYTQITPQQAAAAIRRLAAGADLNDIWNPDWTG